VKTLPDNYKANGWHYKLVKRVGDLCLYSQSMHPDLPNGGKAAAYEVFIANKSEASTKTIGGNEVSFEASEAPPSSASWGRKGWTLPCRVSAEAKFEEILAKISDANSKKGHSVAA